MTEKIKLTVDVTKELDFGAKSEEEICFGDFKFKITKVKSRNCKFFTCRKVSAQLAVFSSSCHRSPEKVCGPYEAGQAYGQPEKSLSIYLAKTGNTQKMRSKKSECMAFIES